MIKEHAVVWNVKELYAAKRQTGVSVKSLDRFYTWYFSKDLRVDDKETAAAMREIRSKIPKNYLLGYGPKYPLYRAITVAPHAIHRLQEATKPIKLKPWLVSSWFPSYAQVDGQSYQPASSDKVGLVVEASPKRVLFVITDRLLQWVDPESVLSGMGEGRTMGEVLIYGNGIDFLVPRVIKSLSYKGQSITVDKFQTLFKEGEDERLSGYDFHLRRWLGRGYNPMKIKRKPEDGKNFIYLIKYATNKTFAEVIMQLEHSGFVQGPLRFNKQGKKTDLINKADKIGIQIEENSNSRMIRLTIIPFEEKI